MPDSQDINNPFLPVDQKTTKKTAQDGFKFDPSTAKPVQNKPLVADVEGFQFDPSTAKAVNKGFSGHARDLGASLMGGLAAVPDVAVGIADLYSGGRAGKAIDNLSDNFKLGEAQKHWQDQKTDMAKVQSQEFADAEEVVDKTKVALSNPSMLANAVVESLPSMAVGGLAGRAVNVASKGAIGAAASGAIGEGAVMAGSQAEGIRQQTDNGLLTGGQTAAAAATGVAGSLFGLLGGRIAQKLGFDDVDNMMANGVSREATEHAVKDVPLSSIPKSILMGAVSEGILEELPQSLSEQALQNIALGKDWYENLDDAAVMGTLAGMAMGGGINAYTSTQDYLNAQRNDSGSASPTDSNVPNLPALPGGNGGDALTGEYIPRTDQSSQPEQSRTNYEYDQFSTDADNLLGQGTGFNPMQGNYPENPDSPIAPTTPPLSRQLGINPEDGPLSTAAALAVDTGVSSAQDPTSNTDTPLLPSPSNTPLSDSAAMLDQDESNFPDFKAQHESNIKTLYDQGMGENVTLKNGEQVRLIQTNDEANGEGAYNLNAINNDGEIVGSLGYFTIEEEGNRFNPQLHVDEQHRRNGIATAMYDYAEANGAKIPELDATAGALRTEQGQAFREARHARRNGQEPKQKDVPEFNIDQKIENADHSIEWHKENIELATNEYDKKRSQDAIEELQKEREDLSQKKAANLILGVDGQNKWFGNQDKANAFIEKKNLGDSHQVVKTDNKRFEIQPKESQLSAITPKADAVTLTIDNQIQTMQHQFDSEKSIPKKVHLQKQLESLKAQRADITTQEQSQVPVQKQAISSSFQTQPLDHGTLNVPLAKRGNIDNQLDRYKKEQAAVENEKREIRNSEHADAKSSAKPMFDTLSSDHIKVYADKAGIKPSEAKKELKSMAHWQPEKAVKIFEALKAVKAEQGNSVTPPTLPNLGGVEQIQVLEQQLAVEKSVPKKAQIRKQIAKLQKHSPIDQAAHQAATSIQNDLPEPTQAQIEAGNYKKGHIKVHGLDIAVENPRGSERRGKDPDGNEWAHTMSDHYGYFKRTIGSDKENIDTYVGRNPESEQVFIVDQLDQQTDGFDEHKVMLGFNSQDEAVKAYSSNFDKGWKVGPVHTMTKDEFKTWLKEGDTTKPAGESIQQSKIFAQIQSDSGLTHSIPNKLMDQVHKLGDVVGDLASMKTEGVKTNVLYGKQLLAKIAKLNPDVQVNIVSDLNSIRDKTTRSRLSSGGFYIPDQNILYIYPQTDLWEGSVLELINHELTHTVTEQPITANQVSRENLDKLEEFRGILGEYIWNQGENLDANMAERLRYAYEQDFPHELLAVSTAESNVREVFKKMLGENGFKQLDAIFTEISTNQFKEKQDDRLSPRGQSQQSSRDRAESLSTSDTRAAKSNGATAQSSNGVTVSATDKPSGAQDGSKRSTQTDVRDGTYFDDRFKSVLEDSGRGRGKTLEGISGEDKTTVEPQEKSSDKKRFSRAKNRTASSTVEQVREALVSRFGEKTIADLEAQGILNIVQDPQEGMTGNVEGWYENGKVTLVASNLDADSAVATFLHELGGHGGFQNLMNKDAYADLMQQFERMVEQGNPVAVEAKRLAERELNREVQLDEYLPYMITLASQMQTKNIVQKGAIKRFMDQVISAVKAWLYDKGIKLNLNEKDVLALAERMITAQSNIASAHNQNEDMRFSRQFNAQQTLDNIMNGIKGLNVQSTKNWAGNKWIDWLGLALSGLGRRQLTEIYSKILPSLSKYNELAAQMDADKNDAGAEADTIVREWSNLKDDNQLADLMHDATLAKIDPAKPHVAGDSIIKYKQLRDDFNALSPEAQDIYLKARDAYKKHYAKVHQAIKERILRSELSNTKKAELLKDMDNQFFGYVKGVYFPLARFGKYVVIVRNQNGQVESVSRAETMAEAQKARAEMMKKFPLWKVDRVILDKEFNASRDGVGRGFMSSLFSEVDNLGLSTAEQAEFEDTLSQLYLSSMPDLSWAKHGIHRKGTAGFSQDARRAFAQNMFHGAGYLAKLRYGDQMAEQLDELQKYATEQAKTNPEYDQPKAQRVIDEMNKRHENLMNPKSHPLSSMLTSVGFIYYLGLSPAAAMVNLSQTPLVAYPIMGAKWGFDNAAKELLKASNDFRKGVEFHKVKWEGTKTDLYKAVSADISKFLNKDEQQAYNDAVDRGVIDVTQAHDLAGIAQGEDSGVMWKMRPIMRAASTMFHSAERFNREVTFIAAYRLSRQTGATHDTAFDQAVDATYKGHFDYSSGNRPRIMQGNVAKVLLLFKQFGQNMIYTLSRQTYQSLKGETEAERKEARRALGAVLGMHAAFAGVLGLPLVGFLLGAASWMGGDDDDPWDAEVALRNYLAETFNPTISNLIMKGVPRAVTPIDMSGRVGINNLLLPDVQEGLEGKRWAESAMSAALGPVAGIGTNMVKGAQEISEGHNLRGVETMLPVFLKNFAKTYRYSDEGVQDKTGVSIMDEVSSMDLLVQGMGFSPSDVRTANEGKSAIFNANRKLNERRSSLMTLWSRAKMMDDQEEMDNVWEEIQGFNQKKPTRRITRMNLNQSYRNRKRRIDRAEDGVYLNRSQQGVREAGAFAFGE